MSSVGLAKNMNRSVPEEGQIVSVRKRRFVVADIEKVLYPQIPKYRSKLSHITVVLLPSAEEILA